MTRFFLVASAPYGAHAEQHNPAKATTFGYVANVSDSTVSVIDTANNAVVATINLSVGTSPASTPVGVATTPDGTRAYVSNVGGATDQDTIVGAFVSVIDTASNTVVNTIYVRTWPVGVAFAPERGDHRHQPLAYVTNEIDSTVSVIDTASNQVVATVPVGNGADAVAFATVTPSHRSEQ
jgi:YVTN family beta-propeller protein